MHAPKPPKQRLLDGVVELALADGIADKSLRSIAERVGTSHRMLIHHFGSREELLVEVIRSVEASQRAVLAELSSDPATAGPRLWKQLRSPQLAAQERLFFEVYGQALQGRKWAQPVLDGIVDDWVGPLAGALESSGVDTAEARVAARLCVAVCRGLLLDVLGTGDEKEVDAAMEYFSSLLNPRLADRSRAPTAHSSGESP
jgi:AcrR family transcriptional regulator